MDNLTHFPYKLFHIHEEIAHKSDYGCETTFAIIPKAPARILWDCFIHGGFRKSNLTYLSAPFQVTENEADDARRNDQRNTKEVAYETVDIDKFDIDRTRKVKTIDTLSHSCLPWVWEP